ncbi:hypothetical protein BGW38_009524, partial [Lunasporangiospora selenospora]
MTAFRSFINAHSALASQARRAFSTVMPGASAVRKSPAVGGVNPEMLYLQPRWHVQRESAAQSTGKVLVGMIQKRWNSAGSQPVTM